MTDSCFSWSVELPERGARRVGDRSVRASLRISSEVGGEEELPVALAVGKRLKGLSDGPGAPSSRAELLFRLDSPIPENPKLLSTSKGHWTAEEKKQMAEFLIRKEEKEDIWSTTPPFRR